MHFWKRLLIGLSLLLAATSVWAGSITPRSVTLDNSEEGVLLNASFDIQLGPRLEEAVGRGVPLYFTFFFRLDSPRWYWFDKSVAQRQIDYKLDYHALTRRYRLTIGVLTQSFDTLAQALQVLARVSRLIVAGRRELRAGEHYLATVRLTLDHNQLPKPLQIDALANREWQVDGKSLTLSFQAGDER